jgi:hypothetical protein
MKTDSGDLIKRLSSARWHVAMKTYGNDHSTLIGLIVDWWISECPEKNWALEGGPGNGYREAGSRGQCDALLCRENRPIGVLEVEGSRKKETAIKLGTFFSDYAAERNNELKSLEFGLLLLYSYEPWGKGDKRAFDVASPEEALEEVRKVSIKYHDKAFIVVSVDKIFSRISEGIRTINDYYKGTPSEITGSCYLGGNLILKETFFRIN